MQQVKRGSLMTSVLRQESVAATAIKVAETLRTDAAKLLGTGPAPYRQTCRELLDIVIPVLAAAAGGDHTWPEGTSPRIRSVSARLTGPGPGIDPVFDGVHGLVTGLLGSAMSDTTARQVSSAGSRVITDILTGAHSAVERIGRSIRVKSRSERARELLDGVIPAGEDYDLAPAYAVIGVQAAGPTDPGQLGRAFEHTAGEGALTTLGPIGGYALLPAEDEARVVQLAQDVCDALPIPVWMSLSWRTKAEIVSGRREAGKILSLVVITERPPGVYWLDDVLVEYAVAGEPTVTAKLVQIITPLLEHPALFTTLKALIASDGNRSQAADRLIVHRSTLDYRIQRIEQLTGLRTSSIRELNVLSSAVIAHAITAQSERPQPGR